MIPSRVHLPAIGLTVCVVLSVDALHAAIDLDLGWQLKPGERAYLTTASQERGLAYRAASNNLLLVSRAGSAAVYVLSAVDGSELHTLDTFGGGVGFFPLNKVAVAEDGVVYAANMTLNASTAGFTIYRWDTDDPFIAPSISYQGDPGDPSQLAQRWGDTFAVRGSGVDTQILAGSNNSGTVALFTTTDGVNFGPPILFEGVGDSGGVLGLTFGPGDTFYTKKDSSTLRLVSFDPGTGGSSVQTIASSTVIRVLGSAVEKDYLATITVNRGAAGPGTVPDVLTIQNIASPATPTTEASADLFVGTEGAVNYDNDNTNFAGSIAFGTNAVYVLSTNNGLFCHTIEEIGTVPPTIETDPLPVTVLEDGIVTFTVTATGDQPLSYQWTLGGEDLPDATEPSLEVGPVTTDNEGAYAVRVSNNVGSATSADATLTVLPRGDTAVAAPKWTAAAESRGYLSGSARTHRGMAVNPVTGNVLVVSRELGARVYVLDGQTGADLHELDVTGVSGGLFTLNMIGVADDGAVYACNLTTNGLTTPLRIYRWPSEAPGVAPDLAYNGDPGFGLTPRWGDTMDVRGAGVDTQILLGSRVGSEIAIASTFDGEFFFSDFLSTDAAAGDFGLGVAFGEGDVAWGSSAGRGLRRVAFDLFNFSATTTHLFSAGEFPGGATAIAVNPALKCLAAVVLDTPNTLQLFDISNLDSPPVRLDQELFNGGRANPNVDGTGAVDFGNGVVYGLSTNNGVVALDFNKSPAAPAPTIEEVALVDPDQVRIRFRGAANASYLIELSLDLQAWTDGPTGQLDAQGRGEVLLARGDDATKFARVVIATAP